MKSSKLSLAFGALALGLSLQPSMSWSARAYAAAVSGTITAQPSSSNGTIEIDRKLYHVRASTSAAKLLSSLYVGEVVDVILDGPPNGTSQEVVSIQKHAGS
jgi:hypothetical protein